MDIDIDELLAPVSEELPTGEDLDGSPGRFAIEEAFALDATDEDDAPDIDWRRIIAAIVAQFAETKDLWLATYLMRAGAKRGDMDVVAAGAQTLAGLLERYWDTVHPQLEMVDFIGRKAPCEALTKTREFIGPLRRTVLIQHQRLGQYTGEDFERFQAEGAEAEGYGLFRKLVESEQDAVHDAVAKIDQTVAAIREADGVLTANSGSDTATNFEPTYQALAALRAAVAAFADVAPAAGDEADADEDTDDEASSDEAGDGDDDTDLDSLYSSDDDSDDEEADGASPRRARGGGSGGIGSRDDVAAALEEIVAFYEANEPNSPVPALLKRARSWMDMDFMSLLNDLAPDGAADARKVLGIKDGDAGAGDDDSGGYGGSSDDADVSDDY